MFNIGLSLIKLRSRKAEKLIDGTAVILVEHGELIQNAMRSSRVDKNDIMQSAREQNGIEKIEEIKYAILEKNGTITTIPYKIIK